MRFGTTSTVQQSGALAILEALGDSTPRPPARFVTVIGPSGQILRSAADGNLDLVLTHAPALEERWLSGRWTRRCPFGASRFAIVGPKTDPAHVAGATSAADALRRIDRTGAIFVSRGDSSGTHEKELGLWKIAGLHREPGDTYFETGGDQTSTLRLADEWGAYALADLPTLAQQKGLALAVLFTGDSVLANPYTLYAVGSDSMHTPGVRDSLIDWMLAVWRPRVLSLRLPDGTPAFSPRSPACESASRPT